MRDDERVAKDCDIPMRHNRIRDIGTRLLLEKKVRIVNDPAGVGAPMTGSDQPESSEEQGKADVTIASIRRAGGTEQYDALVGRLDQVRDQYESSRLNRIRLMAHARKQGMSCHDIGVVLGITAEGVRAAIKRAGDLD